MSSETLQSGRYAPTICPAPTTPSLLTSAAAIAELVLRERRVVEMLITLGVSGRAVIRNANIVNVEE